MKKNLSLICLILILVSSPYASASDDYINKKSPYSVSKTLDRLENVLKQKGLTIFTRVDHGAGAKRVNTPLHTSQLLIFGNPKTGSPLMLENPMMGLDLPMKALAWEDKQGQVWLTYLKPSVLEQRHKLVNNKAIIQKITTGLDSMTSKALEK